METRRFGGKERDAETGFDYFGARYYSSSNGRFTSVDPAYIEAENLVDPQRWNRYVYARNNPLRYTDPDGRMLDTILDIAFTAYDVFDLGRSIYRGEGVSGGQVGALAADVAGIFIPFATGGGAAVRAAARADDVAHLAKTAESASSFGKKGVDFVVTEAGRGDPRSNRSAWAQASEKRQGVIFAGGSGGHGLDPRTSNVRIMDPVGPRGTHLATPVATSRIGIGPAKV